MIQLIVFISLTLKAEMILGGLSVIYSRRDYVFFVITVLGSDL